MEILQQASYIRSTTKSHALMYTATSFSLPSLQHKLTISMSWQLASGRRGSNPPRPGFLTLF